MSFYSGVCTAVKPSLIPWSDISQVTSTNWEQREQPSLEQRLCAKKTAAAIYRNERHDPKILKCELKY